MINYLNLNLICNNKNINLKTPAIMGILNINDESFSDGGLYSNPSNAINRAIKMAEEGANIIDIGAESTKPNATKIDLITELQRLNLVAPILIKEFYNTNVAISIDTYKLEVMQIMLDYGVDIINDIYAFESLEKQSLIAKYNCGACIMHMQNTPQDMQINPQYTNVVADVKDFLLQRAKQMELAGVNNSKIILDVGFGFGKTIKHNIELLKHINEFSNLGYIHLVGLSRKSFLGYITHRSIENRLSATISANMLAVQNGANILRVHDIAEIKDMLNIISSISS